MKKTTSWGNVAKWYDSLLEGNEDTYQSKVILPNLIRNLSLKKGERVLDIACGQGFFSRELYKQGAEVSGVDISKKLIKIAEKNSPRQIYFHSTNVSTMPMFENNYFDKAISILALQNIEDIDGALHEIARVLKKGGSLFIVLNHPTFRILKRSSWERDSHDKQYRRIDSYLSESKENIQMHPGSNPEIKTISFNRSLQIYFKMFRKNGFVVRSLEEWVSHKKSEGKHAKEENRIRGEIPLFMFLEIIKL